MTVRHVHAAVLDHAIIASPLANARQFAEQHLRRIVLDRSKLGLEFNSSETERRQHILDGFTLCGQQGVDTAQAGVLGGR